MTSGSSTSRHPVRSATRVAEQEVVVAPDQVDRHAGGDGLGQRGLDLGVGCAVVVVSEPQVEHVAEEVEPLRPPHGTGKKFRERGDRAGPVRREMDIAGEQEHYGRVGCVTVGPEGERAGSDIGCAAGRGARHDSRGRRERRDRARLVREKDRGVVVPGDLAGTAPTLLVSEFDGRRACSTPHSVDASGSVPFRDPRRERSEDAAFPLLRACCTAPGCRLGSRRRSR